MSASANHRPEFQRDLPLWQHWLPTVRTVGLVLLILLTAGAVSMPLQRPVWERIQAEQPALALEEMEESLGQGILFGLFGGFRTLIADLTWLRAMEAWKDDDRAQTEALTRLTTRIDPRPGYFWINASRIIGLDIPVWRIREHGPIAKVPQHLQQQIRQQQAQRALDLLREALQYHPEDPQFLIEIATTHAMRLDDPLEAARYYKQAWEANGPYFAARLHAEMLRRAEQPLQALEFYRALYPTLPAEEPLSGREIVRSRILELEEELAIDPGKRFRFED